MIQGKQLYYFSLPQLIFAPSNFIELDTEIRDLDSAFTIMACWLIEPKLKKLKNKITRIA